LTSATTNVAVGSQAGASISGADAIENVIIGGYAGTGGSGDLKRSVAIGKNALNSTAANDSLGQVAIGYNALTALTSGAANTAIGYESGKALTTGGSNISLGYQAHLALVSGDNNVAIGVNAADAMAVGESENIAIGTSALGGMDEGTAGGDIDGNIAIGHAALVGGDLAGNDRQVQDNIAIGRNALNSTSDNAQTGTIAIGGDALTSLTSGAGNTAIGYLAMATSTVNHSNVAIGYAAMRYSNGNESQNVAIGYEAGTSMDNNDSSKSILIGYRAGKGGTGEIDRCVVIGDGAMDGTGAVGAQQNIFIGNDAGGGTWTTAACNSNVAIGATAMAAALNGALGNTTVGHDGLKALTTADYNTAIGYQAGDSITSGPRNTLVGYQAGDNIGVGENNIMIGYNADANATATSNTIVIGTDVTPTSSGQTILGTDNQPFTLIGGGKAICRVSDHNIAAGNSKNITLALAAHQGWISGMMHIVASDSGNNGGGVYQVSFSAFLDADATTSDITQTIIHSDRGPGSSNYIELNSPTAGTGNINWVLDNDHSGAINGLTITVEAYMQANPIRYLSLATS
jgi:hypothetical protein